MVKARGWDGAAATLPRCQPDIDDELRLAESCDRAWRVGYGFGREHGLQRGLVIGSLVATVICLGVRLWI